MSAGLATWKKLVFGLLTAAVVLAAAFALVEAGLRLAGYGHSARFHREVRDADGRRWWRENRWVTAPYFPAALIRRPQPFRIPAAKPPGTYRVFVLGSSAAMGDPEPAFSIARVLDVLLREAYPEVRFEIVNAGITAINSHVVRAVAADCAELAPDLFIVYEGNNEVIGPYGPGTVFSPFFRSTAAIRLVQGFKATRTGQLAAALARRFGAERDERAEWGGMQMFLQHEIGRDDPRLETTRAQFRANLRAIARAGRDAGAAVWLCTVLTNQKDFGPFASRHRAGISDEALGRWRAAYAAGEEAVRAGDFAAAEAHFRAALAIDDRYAELPFRLGQLCRRTGRMAEAKALFQQALDADALRFRTDSRLNAIVRDVAAEAPLQAKLVDLASAMERRSADGMLGDELLYEHVHLSLEGTYRVARELYDEVASDLRRRGLVAVGRTAEEPLPIAEVRTRLGYTTYEQAMIFKELQARFSRPPFTAQVDHRARVASYARREEAAARMLALPDARAAMATLYDVALAQRPDDWMLRRNAGMALVALGLPERGRPLLEEAAAIIPDDPDTLYALGTAQRALGDGTAARRTFAALRELEPAYPGLEDER